MNAAVAVGRVHTTRVLTAGSNLSFRADTTFARHAFSLDRGKPNLEQHFKAAREVVATRRAIVGTICPTDGLIVPSVPVQAVSKTAESPGASHVEFRQSNANFREHESVAQPVGNLPEFRATVGTESPSRKYPAAVIPGGIRPLESLGTPKAALGPFAA